MEALVASSLKGIFRSKNTILERRQLLLIGERWSRELERKGFIVKIIAYNPLYSQLIIYIVKIRIYIKLWDCIHNTSNIHNINNVNMENRLCGADFEW